MCRNYDVFAIKTLESREGHKLAVLGLGGLGHMAVKFGVAFGAEVTVLSTSANKEADAKNWVLIILS
jgi:D-arabinose 1-dehydrogenase-like Zn-dependent alcohol dehydrogenase